MKDKNIIFTNASIITMDDDYKNVEAMVINDDIIQDLGSKKHILAKYNNAKIVDLKGQTIVPGFNDAHLHLYYYAEGQKKVDLKNARSCTDIIDKSREYIQNNNPQPGDWIEGVGWNDKNFIDSSIPTKDDLDKISTEFPIILARACFHVVVVNSKALTMAGIDKNTPEPYGGQIGHTDSGQPNGLLYDNAIGLVQKNIPHRNCLEIKKLLEKGFADLLAKGITSVQTDDLLSVDNPETMLNAYLELTKENKIPVRVNLQMRATDIEGIKKYKSRGYTTGYKVNNLHFGPIKLMLDGSLGARTAALIEPYSDDPENRGHVLYSQKELNDIVLTAHKNGFQLAIHTIGDRSLKMALDAYENMLTLYPVKDSRPLIVHAQISNKQLNKKMKKLGVIPVIQPIFLNSDWPIVEKRLGKSRSLSSYAWKQYLEEGLTVTGSSDAPVEPFAPLYGIYCAVTRKDLDGKPENGWHSDETISVREALVMYTKAAAYQSYSEKNKGTLTPGKMADFIVLSDNITCIDPEKIKDVTVQQTYVGGKCVYQHN